MIRSKVEVGPRYDAISKFVQVMEGDIKATLVHAFLASFGISGLSRWGAKKHNYGGSRASGITVH